MQKKKPQFSFKYETITSNSQLEDILLNYFPWEVLLVDLKDNVAREQKGWIASSINIPFPYIPQEETKQDQFFAFETLVTSMPEWREITFFQDTDAITRLVIVYGEKKEFSEFFLEFLHFGYAWNNPRSPLSQIRFYFFQEDPKNLFSKEIPHLWETVDTSEKPAQILSYLYLGSYDHASSESLLREFQIKRIINLAPECSNNFPDSIKYYKVKFAFNKIRRF